MQTALERRDELLCLVHQGRAGEAAGPDSSRPVDLPPEDEGPRAEFGRTGGTGRGNRKHKRLSYHADYRVRVESSGVSGVSVSAYAPALPRSSSRRTEQSAAAPAAQGLQDTLVQQGETVLVEETAM